MMRADDCRGLTVADVEQRGPDADEPSTPAAYVAYMGVDFKASRGGI